MVLGDPPEFYKERDDTITNPLIIIEVMSESTRNHDRGDKFMFYRALLSFKVYILVDQYSIHIEHFYIGADGNWIVVEYDTLRDILNFSKINFQIFLKDIYYKVDFENIKNYSMQ